MKTLTITTASAFALLSMSTVASGIEATRWVQQSGNTTVNITATVSATAGVSAAWQPAKLTATTVSGSEKLLGRLDINAAGLMRRVCVADAGTTPKPGELMFYGQMDREGDRVRGTIHAEDGGTLAVDASGQTVCKDTPSGVTAMSLRVQTTDALTAGMYKATYIVGVTTG